jgi:hypothetical protein|tara:strand:+ start:158 stop:1423 length:1266 start_codon:yes stop_codon:yes gene_type:complete
MKIKLIALIFLINISIALAQVDINIYRDNYSSLETLQAEITLDNPTKNLSANDITIDNTKIAPFIFNLAENKYFVYFDLLNLESKNHSLIVNSRFLIDNALTDVQRSKEFNIIDSDSSLSIKPAILFIDENDLKQSYKITLKNNKDTDDILDVSVNLTSDFLYPARKILSFVRNEEKNLFIFTQQGVVEDSKIILTYDRVYEIPIVIKSTEETQGSDEINNIEEVDEKVSFVTAESSLIRTLNTNQAISGPLEFKNNLDRNLNVKFYLTGNLDEVIRLKTTQITLSANKEDSQTLFINEQKNAKGIYSGSLMLEAEGYTEEFPIELTFVDEEIIIEDPSIENGEDSSDSLEPPDEDFTPGVDFLGILNSSEEPTQEEGKSSSLFPIMLIVIVVLLLLIIFYLIKIQKPKKNFKETISSIKK